MIVSMRIFSTLLVIAYGCITLKYRLLVISTRNSSFNQRLFDKSSFFRYLTTSIKPIPAKRRPQFPIKIANKINPATIHAANVVLKSKQSAYNKPYVPNQPKIHPKPKQTISLHHHYHINMTSYGEVCNKQSSFTSQPIPVYYINLDNSTKRRSAYQQQMNRLGFPNSHRISAVLPSHKYVSVSLSITPARDNEPKEMSCLISHLIAIHTAINDERYNTYPYALITEDDVLYELDVNYTALAESAPSNFGLLQLMSSNANEVTEYYRRYEKFMISGASNTTDETRKFPLWLRWDIEKSLWSTQSYLIHKQRVKLFIDRVITRILDDQTPSKVSYRVNLINPSNDLFPCNEKEVSRGFKCFFPYRIVADYYLYLGCGPTYFSKIPIFNGAKVESTIHTRSSRTHASEFDQISKVIVMAKNNTDILPPFIKPFRCL